MSRIKMGDIDVDVVLKNVKNVRLTVHAPEGRVRISAPRYMSVEAVRDFAISKLGWIERQRARVREHESEAALEYVDRESHYVWGTPHLLSVRESDEPPSIELEDGRVLLRVRPGSDLDERRALVEEWYRGQLNAAVPPLLAQWQPLLGVTVERFFLRRMKTRWGSCSPASARIRLNTDLARRPRECLEYVVVHEMVHLLEPSHNACFAARMDAVMPDWRARRKSLNGSPVLP